MTDAEEPTPYYKVDADVALASREPSGLGDAGRPVFEEAVVEISDEDTEYMDCDNNTADAGSDTTTSAVSGAHETEMSNVIRLILLLVLHKMK